MSMKLKTKEPTVKLLEITPELAAEWLTTKNGQNRKLSDHYASILARDVRQQTARTTARPAGGEVAL